MRLNPHLYVDRVPDPSPIPIHKHAHLVFLTLRLSMVNFLDSEKFFAMKTFIFFQKFKKKKNT